MEEWKEYKLGDLSLGKGTYGIGAAAVPYSPVLHTYLRITDINDDGTLNKAGLMSVNDDNAEDYILQPNDIVFARTGNSTGRTYFYNSSDGELVYAGFLIKFSLDEKKVNPRILKFYTHSKPYYDWVRSFDTGGTRGNINATTYASMPIVLPPRNLQDKIVSILSSLDDKIELNRKINANLEAQAQALFKSWFVDFEPFKDQPFVESELGMIPEGWRVEELENICTIKYGKGLGKNDLTQKGFPVFGGNGIIGFYTQYLYELPQILVSCRGAASGKIIESLPQSYVTSNSLVLELKDRFYYNYLKFLLLSSPLYDYATGSAQPQITIDNIKGVKILLPLQEAIQKMNPTLENIGNIQRTNEQESRRLASLRDTLLPRLMSGELKVNEVI